MLAGQPVRQLAYYVDDVRAAATQHVALYGSGPFFIMDYPPLTVNHRGREVPFNHTAAIGQWGSMQVEVLQQNDDGPSVLHDLYPVGSGKTGLHHVALFVDDLEDAVAAFARAGHAEAARISPPGMNVTAVFIDAIRTYGHFIELYEPKPILTNLYDMVAKAAIGYDGRDPVRTVKL
jgi:hypothetical protein